MTQESRFRLPLPLQVHWQTVLRHLQIPFSRFLKMLRILRRQQTRLMKSSPPSMVFHHRLTSWPSMLQSRLQEQARPARDSQLLLMRFVLFQSRLQWLQQILLILLRISTSTLKPQLKPSTVQRRTSRITSSTLMKLFRYSKIFSQALSRLVKPMTT